MDSSNDGSTTLKCSMCQKEETSKEKTKEIFACKNGHDLCSDCWNDSAVCGPCIEKSLNVPLIQLLDRIPIMCKYKKNGCKELIRVDEVEDHEKFCYYREEHCCLCEKEFPLQEINDHLYFDHKKQSTDLTIREFSRKFFITWSKPKDNKTLYQVIRIKRARAHFLVKLMDFFEKSIICVQYLGEDQENAGEYKYDIKIIQELTDSYISFSGFCMPYVFSDEETKKQNFNSIFLTDKEFTNGKFKMEMTISEVNPPEESEEEEDEERCTHEHCTHEHCIIL